MIISITQNHIITIWTYNDSSNDSLCLAEELCKSGLHEALLMPELLLYVLLSTHIVFLAQLCVGCANQCMFECVALWALISSREELAIHDHYSLYYIEMCEFSEMLLTAACISNTV